MTNENGPTVGTPCWADLWTSDLEGSRRFYSELFGWVAQAPDPNFGGYFMFTRDGVPVAGGMGDMEDAPADNTWKVYFAVDDLEQRLAAGTAQGARAHFPPMAVADMGVQAVASDPTGAVFGLWQPGTFTGFHVSDDHGSPNWFELSTRDYAKAQAFYTTMLGYTYDTAIDTPEMKYSTVPGEGETLVCGLMDASAFLPEGVPAHWSIYWSVDSADKALERVEALGGTVVLPAETTPYGRLATATDPAGAQFKLRETA